MSQKIFTFMFSPSGEGTLLERRAHFEVNPLMHLLFNRHDWAPGW